MMSATMGEEIQGTISKVLPGITEDKKKILLQRLVNWGVESKDDLKYVEGAPGVDLSDLLLPIQIRKLFDNFKTEKTHWHGDEQRKEEQKHLRDCRAKDQQPAMDADNGSLSLPFQIAMSSLLICSSLICISTVSPFSSSPLLSILNVANGIRSRTVRFFLAFL
ncbi:hypothetical protein DNTS_012996 [Danionella cerebrum]|uniref:Uncharacterized protein n=1 Tax=Danionella cerebrum TaxID=2873325 RepID=A0A553RPT4_9TELE|nr:hypothetical protein DNTS_012996 [Danionella translucida]